jgi:hypothetical protein
MKKLLLIITIFFIIFSQVKSQISAETGGQPELYMYQDGYYLDSLIISPIGEIYCHPEPTYAYETTYFDICDDCGECYNCDGGSAILDGATGKTGWGSCVYADDVLFNAYGWGVYKLYASGTNNYCYFDFRDSDYNYRYDSATVSPYPGVDIKVEYDHNGFDSSYSNYHFRVKPFVNPSVYDWDYLDTGELAQVWKIFDFSKPNNEYFIEPQDQWDFWEDCLVLVNSENKPRLIWSAHPTFTTTNYKIYRAVMSYPMNPNNGTYYLIHTTADTIFSFVDNDVNLSQNDDYIYYYVKAYNSNTSTYSERTNYEGIYGEYAPYKNSVKILDQHSNEFVLSQNLPNPFNPITKINYLITSNGFVTLLVYDHLGRVVDELVSESKAAGEYTATFDGSALPSGVYYYTLRAGQYVQTKKMILLK